MDDKLLINETRKLAKTLIETLNKINERQTEISNELSIADQKISDIRHYIELSDNLNAAQGYGMYSLLKDALNTRRLALDEQDEIGVLLNLIKPTGLLQDNKIRSIERHFKNKMEFHCKEEKKRHYNVRVLKDIFGDTIK